MLLYYLTKQVRKVASCHAHMFVPVNLDLLDIKHQEFKLHSIFMAAGSKYQITLMDGHMRTFPISEIILKFLNKEIAYYCTRIQHQ